ncbi:MAG: methionyl-tRNA formyltransferase [Bdellovibrionales bacterium]|nr:methionyl-tRNA formyltransferase [Bdellovibrionales bacterium]MCB0333509.1 methionyl-tRNA formyltransferase [Bdellovibrionales bacterium]
MSSPEPIVFFGTPDFSVFTLEALLRCDTVKIKAVVTQPDRPAGRGAKLQASPVKTCALNNDIPVLQPTHVRKELKIFSDELNQYGPFSLGIVVAFGQILPLKILELPTFGSVNIHASLLPRWRGAAPIQRAIMEGDTETGVCLMKMDEGLDTGPVYLEQRTPISESDTAGSLHDRLGTIGATLLCDHIQELSTGQLPSRPQPSEGVTYAKKIEKAEAKIDWARSAHELSCHIRGLSPFPGAFTLLDGKRLKVLHATVVSEYTEKLEGSPGSVYYCDDDRLEIACGQGILSLKELQLEGKKKLPTRELLKGISIPAHTIFE